MTCEIVVFTNNSHLWLLPGFQYLFNKYWSSEQKVIIAGYAHPKTQQVRLRKNFKFQSIDRENYPADKWTNGLRKFLCKRKCDIFIMLLEDYWLNSPVLVKEVDRLCDYMQRSPERILRIDLTADRASQSSARPFTSYDGIELLKTPSGSDYQMSFQAAIWNRKHLLEVLVPNESPWQAELAGSRRLKNRPDLLVLGTYIHPVKYRPVYRTHRKTLNISSLPTEDQEKLAEIGGI